VTIERLITAFETLSYELGAIMENIELVNCLEVSIALLPIWINGGQIMQIDIWEFGIH
jgi:hypothetical protein